MTRLTDSMDFHAQALVLRAQRQRLIASNIANADTPGYVARDMDFASALRQATGQVPAAGTLAASQSGHIARPLSAAGEPNLRYATASQASLDNNSVDMDRERASFADNTVKYEATLRFINGQARTLLDAMRSPSQG